MKKIYLYLIFIGIAVGCEKQELNLQQEEDHAFENEPYLEKISFQDLPENIQHYFEIKDLNRNKTSLVNTSFGKIRRDIPAKKIITKEGEVNYTLVLDNLEKESSEDPFYFDNLVVYVKENGSSIAYVIRYIPTSDWRNNSKDFKDFSGRVEFYFPNGEKISQVELVEGIAGNLGFSEKRNDKAECALELERNGFICTATYDASGNFLGEDCETIYKYKWTCTMGSGEGDYTNDPALEEPDGLPRTGGTTSPTYPEPEEVDVTIGINDTSLDNCLKVILSTLEGHFHGVGKIIAELAETDTSFSWTVESGSLAGETAITDKNFDSASNSTTTTFDSQGFPRGTDLSWARTILHESVHAYVVGISNTSTLAERQELLGPNWTIAYFNYGHDYIAETYVNSMADILQEYGQLKGYTMDRQFYEDLAWGGLQGTNAFNSLSTTVKNRILDVSAIELTGKDRYGNNKTQKGSDAGC